MLLEAATITSSAGFGTRCGRVQGVARLPVFVIWALASKGVDRELLMTSVRALDRRAVAPQHLYPDVEDQAVLGRSAEGPVVPRFPFVAIRQPCPDPTAGCRGPRPVRPQNKSEGTFSCDSQSPRLDVSYRPWLRSAMIAMGVHTVNEASVWDSLEGKVWLYRGVPARSEQARTARAYGEVCPPRPGLTGEYVGYEHTVGGHTDTGYTVGPRSGGLRRSSAWRPPRTPTPTRSGGTTTRRTRRRTRSGVAGSSSSGFASPRCQPAGAGRGAGRRVAVEGCVEGVEVCEGDDDDEE